MAIQPRTAPMHQTNGVFPKASRKFSLLIDKSRVRDITFTRFFGVGRKVTITLPARVASPTAVLMIPNTVSPPFGFESIMAGSAAS